MEANNDFLMELETVLEQQRESLENKEFQDLKGNLRLFTSAYDGIYNLFLKKGLVTEDPYKYEQKISEITPPSSDSVLDSEKINAISQRLSVYDSQLDFLNNFYQFSADFITMPRIKKIILLIKWVKWEKLSEASMDINTKILAELFGRITQGTDKMSISLINDSLKRMCDLSKKIVSILKIISVYQREKYKFDIRGNIIIQLGITPKDMQAEPEDTLIKIKQNFVKVMGKGIPFYSELIKEIFAEEGVTEGDSLKSELIKKLSQKKVKKEEKKEINYRQLLMDAVRVLSTVSIPLEQALNKLDFNNSLIKEKTLSFGDKFKLWIMNFSQKESEKKIIAIEIFDERLSSNKTIQLNFTEYLEDGKKKMRTMAALSNKVSTIYRKLETASEDAVLSFISKSLEDITIIAGKLDPVNTYLKSEAGRDQRKSLKGVKIEYTSIKNILVKTNQKRHEYISRMEEIEQMKKLGVL
ncbi:MAG: hypothetical protein KAQ93_02880 [Spirochaetales bacterium]|nr:hypothetical protein [Spirochaetales bacterium]